MNFPKPFLFELICWVVALILLAFSDPQGPHFSLCPLAALGLEWCWGCGIGRSMAALLQGNPIESWKQHWFGIPALLILVYRISQLSGTLLKNKKKLNYKEI